MTNALVFNKVIGGISKGAQKKATIVVTYPSGATCTVSDGSKTYTALDTSGSAAFVVNAGTWTVIAAQDGESRSETVTAAAGSFAAVKLRFWDGTLYDAGNEYTEQTGGWAAKSGGVTKNENSITVIGPGSYYTNIVATQNKIDLTDHTQLHINITNAIASDGNTAGGLCIYAANSFESIDAAAKNISTGSTGEHILDISDIEGEYFVGYQVSGTTGVTRSMTFDKVWLT